VKTEGKKEETKKITEEYPIRTTNIESTSLYYAAITGTMDQAKEEKKRKTNEENGEPNKKVKKEISSDELRLRQDVQLTTLQTLLKRVESLELNSRANSVMILQQKQIEILRNLQNRTTQIENKSHQFSNQEKKQSNVVQEKKQSNVPQEKKQSKDVPKEKKKEPEKQKT